MSFNLEKDVSTTVSIIIGSESDLELANKCSDTLESLSITNSTQVLSAHRTPGLLENHVRECEEGGTKVFVAIAGLAAHLAGAVASKTILPVIGVPGDGGPLRGMDGPSFNCSNAKRYTSGYCCYRFCRRSKFSLFSSTNSWCRV